MNLIFRLPLFKKKNLLILIWLFIGTSILTGQETEKQKNYFFSGYIKGLNTAMFEKIDGTWLVDNMFHHRINFKWYMSDNFTSSIIGTSITDKLFFKNLERMNMARSPHNSPKIKQNKAVR